MDRTAELDRRVAELNARDEEIEDELFRLMPARLKTDGPASYEDYTGEIGEERHSRWEHLMRERDEINASRNEAFSELARLAR